MCQIAFCLSFAMLIRDQTEFDSHELVPTRSTR